MPFNNWLVTHKNTNGIKNKFKLVLVYADVTFFEI